MYTIDYDNEFLFFWIPPMQTWPAFDSWEMWLNYFIVCFIVNILCFTQHYYFGESND